MINRARGRKKGEMLKLGRSDLALAYELRQEGVRHGLIARNLGCNPGYLYTLLVRCELIGLSWNNKP
ncbi:hypothetical protein [Agrobacterium tumefaciens]|uniref:hypothetical protein n=1 Tax=Agrobacterium tumefaciens TaxID=358 RepID=UPI001572549F|nr:hypothetical protein [Agrobacterium tumefaciens]